MKQEVKDAWVQALESGDYEQGRSALRTADGKYCCLGVLCDLAVKAGVAEWVPSDYHRSNFRVQKVDDSLKGSGSYLPTFVMEWAGVENDNATTGDFNVVTPFGGKVEETNLASLNDQGHPFHAIAQLIREQL